MNQDELEKIFRDWTGYEYELCNKYRPYSLDILFEIGETKLKELWGERVSITFRHFEDALLRPNEKPCHCTLGKWDIEYSGFVLIAGGFGSTYGEALMEAFYKIAMNKV